MPPEATEYEYTPGDRVWCASNAPSKPRVWFRARITAVKTVAGTVMYEVAPIEGVGRLWTQEQRLSRTQPKIED